MCKMKIYQNDESLYIFESNCVIMGFVWRAKFLYQLLCYFYFAHASMIIKIDIKVIDSLRRLYLNEYYII